MQSIALNLSSEHDWATPDGVGLQDHYAQMWQHIASRYANNPTVIGYDLMNQPFSGSMAQEYMHTMQTAYGKMIHETTGKELSKRELQLIWQDLDKRTKAFKNLSSAKDYTSVVDALFPYNRNFELHTLQPFYQKVSEAIREVDKSSILFLEHSYLSNRGVRSSIARTTLFDGRPDSLLAYAPHGYNLLAHTQHAAHASPQQLSLIYNRFQETAHRLNMPVWLGQWGAFYNHGPEIVSLAQHAITEIENHLYSNAYWHYQSRMDKLPYFKQALVRPFVAYTNGQLLKQNYNRNNKTLTIIWHEENHNPSPTQLFVPFLTKGKPMKKSQNHSMHPSSASPTLLLAGW